MKKNKLSMDELKLNSFDKEKVDNIKEISNNDIAIIGISVRFPMAEDIDEFWENINNNIDCVTNLPEDRKNDLDRYLRYKGAAQEDFKYIKGAYINEIDQFDYSFFNITPNEAKLMDPSQRIFLEVAWNAIEDAGYSEKIISGKNVGIYVGHISDLDGYKYKQMIYEVDPNLIPLSLAGTLTSLLPSRISYLLNLKGPSMIVDTACSSSLVALNLACQALKNGVCDMAVVGSVRLNILPVDKNYFKVGIESSDDLTRTFDQAGDGSGMGEGAAVIIIKQLSKARRDGDNIYAVIKGSAVNQDGRSMGITAPNPSAQADVIKKAWDDSGIDPLSISYIDIHGTATKLGDTIEIEGIREAFKNYTKEKQFCAVSSVKSNIGHTFDCAGLAGILKAVLALKYKTIPPSVHFNRPNSNIDFNDSPVYVNVKSRKWETNNTLKRCGVSSFGLSGTNCHVVLEEYPENFAEQSTEMDTLEDQSNCSNKTYQIFTLSAKNINSLKELIKKYKELAEAGIESFYDNLCYTANIGRGQYTYRLAFISKDVREFKKKIFEISIAELDKLKGPFVYFGVCKVVSVNKEHLKPGELREDNINLLNKKADEKMQMFENIDTYTMEAMQELCVLYTSGATVNWERLYKGKSFKRISLPVYPFEHSRCWLEIPDTSMVKKEELYYTMEWKLEDTFNTSTVSNGSIMVMGSQGKMVQMLKDSGRDVIEVILGLEYRRIDSNKYIISGAEEDYKKLINDTKQNELSQIIHLFTLQGKQEIVSLSDLEDSQNRGVYSLFFLTKAIHESGIESRIDVVLISEFVNKVTGEEENYNPENASMFGLSKTVSKEHPNIYCKCIDIDRNTDVSQIIAEGINAAGDTHEIAFRKGKRYVEMFSRVDLDILTDNKVEIREGGVYLITGGTGGIGMEVAELLASKRNVRIVLVSRKGMPSRKTWKGIKDADNDTKLIRRMRRINEIEEKGSEILIYSVDVSNINEMRNMLDEVRKKYGKINGIFHGAGIVISKALIEKDKNEFQSVMSPKVQGTWILDMLTRVDNPDFFVLFSSIATIFDTINQGDYIAANSYMDSYASYRSSRFGKTLAIDWSTWRDTGLAVDQNFGIDTLFKSMPTALALKGLERMINKNISRVLIGEMNIDSKIIFLLDKYRFVLSPEISQDIQAYKKSIGKGSKPLKNNSSDKVKLLGRDNQGYTAIEKEIAQVCKDVLGFDEIDINDTFFEVGADSISMKRIYQTLETLYPKDIVVADLFEYPTILKLSQYIADRRSGVSNDENVIIFDGKEDIDNKLNNIFDNMQKGDLTMEQAVYNLSNM